MNDDRDPLLEKLFAQNHPEQNHLEIDAQKFTANVMARTRLLRVRQIAPWIAAALLIAVGVSLLVPLQEFTLLISRVLSITLIDLGESWAAWLFTPINNAASVIIIGVKAIRMARKKIMRISYA